VKNYFAEKKHERYSSVHNAHFIWSLWLGLGLGLGIR